MEFGRLTPGELKKVNFTLPEDPKENARHLKGKPHRKAALFMGCAKWGRPEWVGKLYPKGTKEKDFLNEYVQHYNCIELNATHYKLYGADTTSKWAAVAADRHFRFCPKVYKGISHFGNLSNKDRMMHDFVKGTEGLGKHLGPVFLQLNDRFSPKRMDELTGFLTSLPTTNQFFVEVRHPDWFADAAVTESLFKVMDKLKIGAVITDTAGRRDCLHMRLTCRKTMIRFVGNSLHRSDYQRCDDWIRRLKSWYDQGLQEAWFFMHMHDEARSPQLTQYFAEQSNKLLAVKLQEPMPKKK